jgi:pimeloyl-ACP methyl ester carboxylesterase
MPVEVILPKVDMDMTHGTLAVWHVAPGDEVAKGAALFDIETDKAAMEVEAPASGRLHGVTAQPGDKIPVGTVVALIYAEGEVVADVPPPPAAKIATAAPDPAEPTPATPIATASPDAEITDTALRATPAARAAARQSGTDLAQVPGTGPRGRVQQSDVAAYQKTNPETATRSAPMAGWSPQPGPLHVTTRKGSGIPLVLLHGFTADSQSWAPLEKAIGPDRTLIRIDLPGHGRSPRRRLQSFADLARMMVEAFDDAIRAHDQVHLLGHSLGGALALAIADIRSRQVASLTLVAPAGLGPEIDAAALTGITRATWAESLAPWLRRLTAKPDGISDDYARAAMKLRSDPALRACQADMAETLFPDGVQPFDLRPALSRIEAPTTLIWGRSDHILPWRQALAAPGDFALHLLPDAGHVPQIECPDRVARILSRQLVSGPTG